MKKQVITCTYRQETKNQVRHKIIRKAVEILTIGRTEACCVRNSYVRDLYDYFTQLSESYEQTEAAKIDLAYIREWEHMQRNSLGFKRPDELSVCYLSGPEPENDFHELVSMGVLPQNIWAFESEKGTYLQALNSLDGTNYMQPKVIKTTIEHFFADTPKKFDIVYIDACASLISSRHALRCVSSLFQNHRLSSPGVLITNFAMFDSVNRNEYVDLIARYNHIHQTQSSSLVNIEGKTGFRNEFDKVREHVAENLEGAYGDFITKTICDAGSIAIPSLRFCNSSYLQSLSPTHPIAEKQYSIPDVNCIKDNALYKFLASNSLLKCNATDFPGLDRVTKLMSELSGTPSRFDLLSSLRKIHELKSNPHSLCADLKETLDFFDSDKTMYRFLDKPSRILFIDSVINQLSYPMHYVSNKAERLSYVAKETRMFTDLLLFDECRYIYDWIPAIHQITKAFSNPSWQYTFRFCLDGLIKQRLNYNNEFFFQGSVVSKMVPGFEAKTFAERLRVN